MPYYDSSSESITLYLVSAIISLIISIVFGCITKGINENKGYTGGFAWGFWLGWIGIIVVASRQPYVYTPTESIILPAKTQQTPSTIVSHTEGSDCWKCRCGRFNARYVSSCVCGLSKHEVTMPAAPVPAPTSAQATVANPAVSTVDDELKKISVLKEYKALLDAGVITHEEFATKKKSILSQ